MMRFPNAPVTPVTVRPETIVVKVPETPVMFAAEKPLVVKLTALIAVALTVVPVIVTPLNVPLTVALPEVKSVPTVPVLLTAKPDVVV